MKLVVLNGSPKGMNSVTMQYVLFLKKKFPEHEFSIQNVCQDISKLEASDEHFRQITDAVAASDAVLWAFPLYYLLVHAHYKRFIELLFERHAEGSFRNKYAAILSTSIHFFDHTAHEYIRGICEDLGMRCVGGYSAAMYDLLKERERDRLLLFAKNLFKAVKEQVTVPRRYQPVVHAEFAYQAGKPPQATDTQRKSVMIVTDSECPQDNLAKMVERLRGTFHGPVSVVNLNEIRIRGGCTGCIQCGLDNRCIYHDADDIREVYERLMAADVVLLAGTIRDRYLSSRWKLFFDRGFFHGHVPMFVGKQMGVVVSGPLMQLANLRQILESYVLTQQANLVGMVTDECGDSAELDRQLDHFARQMIDSAVAGYIQPPNFLAVGSRKLFRDEIWSNLRLVFRADHRYYRSRGLYDFPSRSLKTRLSEGILTLLLLIPRFGKEFRKRIKDEMVKPLTKVIEDS
jgi:multimeric flavodoxin WrbA